MADGGRPRAADAYPSAHRLASDRGLDGSERRIDRREVRDPELGVAGQLRSAVADRLRRRPGAPSQAEVRLGGRQYRLARLLAGEVRSDLQAPSPLDQAGTAQSAQPLLLPADLLDVYR